MNNESLLLLPVATAMLPRLNRIDRLPMLEECGGIEGFFKESPAAVEALCRMFNLRKDLLNREEALKKAEKEIKEMDRHDIRVCIPGDPAYPLLLKQCDDAPLVLFYKGTLNTNPSNINLAIVGTRHATPRCQAKVEAVVEEMQDFGHELSIVSGLAYGIDASAHRASLKYGLKTYAVLGHGLHMVYPAAHKNLAEKILESGGALLSEFPCCATVIPANFLQRNRIVAGMSQAVLIAESAEKGGAMSTARIALSYDRDVLAIPGRPEDNWSAGCNRLIKENVAALVENGKDVAQALGLSPKGIKGSQTTLFDLFEANENETTLLTLLKEKGSTDVDELSAITLMPTQELLPLLLKLELEGRVTALPGKKYTIN